ncbi:MAG TPA: hypothetical protein VGL71_07255 [Urbifossiella sp.]|jgi:hypothetical protein
MTGEVVATVEPSRSAFGVTMQSRVATWLLSMLLAAGVARADASATQPSDSPSKSVADLVKDVDSADYAAREAATQALMHLSPDHRPEIEAALAKTSNQEAITRLEKVAVHLFMKEQTTFGGKVGLMGVSMSSEMVQLDPKSAWQTCIVVWKTQPGFPSAEVLQPADRLIAINGEPFPAPLPGQDPRDVFRAMINDAGGGAVLTFTLIRNGKMMDVRVRLAGLEDKSFIVQIVEARDRAAEDYRASLKTGRTLAEEQHDLAPANLYDGIPR